MFGKYGVPSRLPNGKRNPEYHKLWKENREQHPQKVNVRDGKYGVPRMLPNGKVNPEWTRRRNRSRGIKPMSNKYGVPSRLPNGEYNPEYDKRRHISKRLAQGKPAHRVLKYGVHSRLPDGKPNPEWHKNWSKQHPENRRELRRRHNHKRRRGLPTSTILGRWFKGSHLHHITPEVAVYIPMSLHTSIHHNIWTGKNMDKINVLAMEFYERGCPA